MEDKNYINDTHPIITGVTPDDVKNMCKLCGIDLKNVKSLDSDISKFVDEHFWEMV